MNENPRCYVFRATVAILLALFLEPNGNRLRADPPAAASVAKQPDFKGFDEFLARVLKEWRVPGVAVAVIHDGRVLLSKGYGYRDLEKRLPVTSKTLFPIASITKPVTATAAAILVDDGKINWNDRVREHLPKFRLHAEEAAAQLTIRDCLAHRTGIPLALRRWLGTAEWSEKHMSPEFAYRTLRYLEPTGPARIRYQYSNSGFLITGQIIDKHGGSWEELIQKRLLNPLRMNRTNFSVKKSQADSDHAKPYILHEGEFERIDFFPLDVVAPAAGINSSVEEMARFLRLYLGQGELDGRRIVSKAAMKDLLTPEVVLPESNRYRSVNGFHSMGWQVFLLDGEKWGRHTGSWTGFTAVVGYCPKRKCGYVVLTNLAFRSTAELVENNIRDRLRGKKPRELFAILRRIDEENEESTKKFRQKWRPPRIKETTPAHPLSGYAGTYSHPAYGDFVVTLDEGALRWRHHGYRGQLKHYHYDVFDMESDPQFHRPCDNDIRLELITFQTDTSGAVTSMTFPRDGMPKDARFRKRRIRDEAETK